MPTAATPSATLRSSKIEFVQAARRLLRIAESEYDALSAEMDALDMLEDWTPAQRRQRDEIEQRAVTADEIAQAARDALATLEES